MIIWSGWGVLVVVIAFAASLVTELSVEFFLHDEAYYQTYGWPLSLALLVSGIVTWYLGSHLNRDSSRTVIDKQTGREEVIGGPNRHRLFFIPMQYWAPILVCLALVPLFSW